MDSLYTLVYVSHATALFTEAEAEVERILLDSRANNARDGITGVLLHRDGNFMQCLEGTEAAVRQTYARIQADRRHTGLIALLEEPIAGRSFPEWTMGHLQPTQSEILALSTAAWRETADGERRGSRGLAALRSFTDRTRARV
jgi:hypothetical protein